MHRSREAAFEGNNQKIGRRIKNVQHDCGFNEDLYVPGRARTLLTNKYPYFRDVIHGIVMDAYKLVKPEEIHKKTTPQAVLSGLVMGTHVSMRLLPRRRMSYEQRVITQDAHLKGLRPGLDITTIEYMLERAVDVGVLAVIDCGAIEAPPYPRKSNPGSNAVARLHMAAYTAAIVPGVLALNDYYRNKENKRYGGDLDSFDLQVMWKGSEEYAPAELFSEELDFNPEDWE